MAKQASKAKAPESKRGSGRPSGRSKASTAARPTAKGAKKTAAPAPSSADGVSPASKPPATGGRKSASAPGSTAKGRKLQAAGKALTSGHRPSGSRAEKAEKEPSVKKKKTSSARPAAGAKTDAGKLAPRKPSSSKGRAVKRVSFDRKTLASIKKSLKDQRQDLLDQLEEIEETAFGPSQTEASSEAGFDEDYADAGTATFEREKDLSIANNINSLVDKIDKALEKIDQGTYGICENCGQPISADRLRALPHVLLCINCKKAEERR